MPSVSLLASKPSMLTIKCAACKKKLWKYEKYGKGEVLRCYKSRIDREFKVLRVGDKILCPCGNIVGIDKGSHIKMIKKGFVYSGQKKNR
jgi:hypothetical protein